MESFLGEAFGDAGSTQQQPAWWQTAIAALPGVTNSIASAVTGKPVPSSGAASSSSSGSSSRGASSSSGVMGFVSKYWPYMAAAGVGGVLLLRKRRRRK